MKKAAVKGVIITMRMAQISVYIYELGQMRQSYRIFREIKTYFRLQERVMRVIAEKGNRTS